MHEHPVRIVVADDLRRSRLTVFFRLILAIPLLLWFAVWGLLVVFVAFFAWLIALVRGRLPNGLHRFFCAFVRFTAHMYAYVWLVENRYPPFGGYAGDYPFDVRLPASPVPQSRWRILVRGLLAIPALLVCAALGGFSFSTTTRGRSKSAGAQAFGVGTTCAFLGWFASVATGRMPRGLRDAAAYSIGYQAQTLAYLFFVTDAYPSADPTTMLADLARPPVHVVHLVGDSLDLRRSRLTVALRLPLAIPHLVWLTLWAVLAVLAVIVQWFVTVVRGRPISALHRFLSSYVRYALHVYAFAAIVANPFPAFTGAPGRYPLDLVLPSPGRQNRWKTGFRLVLAIPAFAVGGALGSAIVINAVLMWFVALVKGAAPEGLRNLSAYGLRYMGQSNAYILLITDAYPNASPLEGAEPDELGNAELLDEAA